MKTIKLKRKYLLVIALSLSLVVIFNNAISDTYKKYIPIEARKLINPNEEVTIHDEARRLHHILTHNDFQFYQLFNFNLGGMSMNHVMLSGVEADRIYEEYLQYANSDDILDTYPQYYFDVLLSQWFGGRGDTAKTMLAAIKVDDLSRKYRNYYHLINVAVGLAYYDIDLVNKSMDAIDDNIYKKTIVNVKRFMYYAFGIGEEIPKSNAIAAPLFRNYYIEYFKSIEDYTYQITSRSDKATISLDHTYHGSISMDGQPIQGAFACLVDGAGSSFSFPFRFEFQATDQNGNFSISEYLPERSSDYGDKKDTYLSIYTVSYSLPYQVVADKYVNFPTFTNTNDIYNTLSKGETLDVTLEDTLSIIGGEIEGDNIYFTIDEPNKNYKGNYEIKAELSNRLPNTFAKAIGKVGEDGRVCVSLPELRSNAHYEYQIYYRGVDTDIEEFTPPLYLSSDVIFSITRENSLEHKIIQVQWNQSYILHVPGQEDYNTGDLLLIDDQHEDAIAWYENHPSLHNLEVIMLLHLKGYGDPKNKDPNYKGDPDYDKALHYLYALIEYDGLNVKRLYQLMDCLNRLDRSKDFDEIAEKLVIESGRNENIYWLAKRYAHTSKYQEAINLIDKYYTIETDYDRSLIEPFYLLAGKTDHAREDIRELFHAIDLSSLQPYFDLVQAEGIESGLNWLQYHKRNDLRTMFQLMIYDVYWYDFHQYADDINPGDNWYNNKNYYYDKVDDIEDVKIKQFLIKYKQQTDWFN